MIPPTRLSNEYFLHINQNTKEINVKIAVSISAVISTWIGLNIEEIPKIHKILNKLDPIIFPIAISFSPFLAATTLVTSSGRLVPTATIVSPIKVSLNPNILAKEVAPSTVNFPCDFSLI